MVENNQNCGLDYTTQQKMEILQNSVIFEDEENEQSYRDGAFDERLLLSLYARLKLLGMLI